MCSHVILGPFSSEYSTKRPNPTRDISRPGRKPRRLPCQSLNVEGRNRGIIGRVKRKYDAPYPPSFSGTQEILEGLIIINGEEILGTNNGKFPWCRVRRDGPLIASQILPNPSFLSREGLREGNGPPPQKIQAAAAEKRCPLLK